MARTVITGAVISISSGPKGGAQTAIGRAMAMQVQETYRVVPVFGIGRLTAQELPILQYAGAFTMQQFAISSEATKNLMGSFNRPNASGDVTNHINSLLYNEGVDVTVKYKSSSTDTAGTALMMITGAVCQAESTTVQENQIVLRDGTFIFADPMKVS